MNQVRSSYVSRIRRLDPHQATDVALREPLSRQMTLDVNEAPLQDVIEQIADTIGIPIRIDDEALANVGRDSRCPITISLADVPAQTLIRLILPMDLTSIPRHGHLVITSRDAANDDPAIWFYPPPHGLDAFEIRDIVERLVEPDCWDSVGGPYSIVSISGGISEGVGVSIRAPDETHERILPLLVGLDQAARQESAAGTAPRPRHVRVHTVPDSDVREALCEQLVAMCNKSLADSADPEAEVSEIGKTLVVWSTSPEFHFRAANLISTIVGRERPIGERGMTEVMP